MEQKIQLIFVTIMAVGLPSLGQLIRVDPATPSIKNTSVTESYIPAIEICREYQCIGKEQCRGMEDSFICNCDADCAFYKDCCWSPDENCRYRVKLDGSVTNTTSKICTYTEKKIGYDQQSIRVGYFMIASCPSHYPDNYVKNLCIKQLPQISQKLEEYIHHVPVSSYNNKETYKNVYCAKCNDIDYEDMRFWQLLTTSRCDPNKPSEECDDIRFSPRQEIYDDEILPRKCVLSDAFTCLPSSPFYEQCMSYSAVISIMGMSFKNPHCALCYDPGIFFPSKEICPHAVDDRIVQGTMFGRDTPHIVPFDFSVFDEESVSYKTVTCSRGLLYNSSSGLCDFVSGSEIIRVGDDLRKSCCQVIIRFELNSENSGTQKSAIIDTLSRVTVRYFSIPSYDVNCSLVLNETIELSYLLLNVSQTFDDFYKTAEMFSRDVIEKHGLPIELSNITADCSSCSVLLCQKETSSWFEQSKIVLFTHDGITSAKMGNENRVFSDITWGVMSYGMCDVYNNTCEWNIRIIICSLLQERPLCPHRIFTNDSFSLEENENGTLHLLSDVIEGSVPPFDYVILSNGNACVCSRYYEEKLNLIILIISLVLTTLSLVTLILTFVTYCTFKNLRNLPGKITMNFVVSLFFAQIVLIPATFWKKEYSACQVIGIMGHYLWLSTFIWMSVIAYDVSRTFGMESSTLKHVTNNAKTFFIYVLIGWGIPGGYVIICVIVQLSDIQNLQFAYVNAEENCWLWPQLANLILFGIPAILCLSFNYISFIFTVRGLHRSKTNARTVTGQISLDGMVKQEVFLVMKVSILMGLCWIWAILYGFFRDNAVLLYLHTILNPLQGFFVFCIYVCNKRVLPLWSGTYRKFLGQSESSKAQNTRNTDSSNRSNVRTTSTVL